MERKDEKESQKKEISWDAEALEKEGFVTLRSDNVLLEDPEFPVAPSRGAFSEEPDFSSLHSNVDRKKEEIKNSTIGGF